MGRTAGMAIRLPCAGAWPFSLARDPAGPWHVDLFVDGLQRPARRSDPLGWHRKLHQPAGGPAHIPAARPRRYLHLFAAGNGLSERFRGADRVAPELAFTWS